jgi:hypothetical protein
MKKKISEDIEVQNVDSQNLLDQEAVNLANQKDSIKIEVQIPVAEKKPLEARSSTISLMHDNDSSLENVEKMRLN